MADVPLLPEFVVGGQTYETFDYDQVYNYLRSLEQPPDTGGEAAPADTGGMDAGLPAFAPLLPEVVVPNLTPQPTLRPIIPPSPPANAPNIVPLGGIGATLATVAGGLLGLLFPQPTGPREYDEAPTPKPPPEPLPEVTVIAPRLPYPLSPLDPFFEVPNVRTNPWGSPGIIFDPYFLPGPGPGQLPDPLGAPGLPTSVPIGDPVARPGPAPLPTPASPTAPDLRPFPDLDPFGNPLGNPLSQPVPVPVPRPQPDRPGRPNPGPDPFVLMPGTPYFPVPNAPGEPFSFRPTMPNPFVDTLLEPFFTAVPQPNADLDPEEDKCNCEKKDKKKKEKRPPRAICYRGSYRQLSKGIQYRRIEQVPCAGPAPKKSTPGKRKKTPSWSDTLNDVFKLPIP